MVIYRGREYLCIYYTRVYMNTHRVRVTLLLSTAGVFTIICLRVNTFISTAGVLTRAQLRYCQDAEKTYQWNTA
jgi:hypothetical protein